MPNIKSAIKRVDVAKKRNLRNRIQKTRMKTAIKRFELALSTKDENLTVLYRKAVSEVDKAASKGVIHKNDSSRKKAQLAKKLAQNA